VNSITHHSKNLSILKIYRGFYKTVDFIYPPYCVGCGKPGSLWCNDCQNSTRLISSPVCDICGYPINKPGVCNDCQLTPPPFTNLRSFAEYNGSLEKAVKSIKYHNNLGLGIIFAEYLSEIVRSMNWNIDCVVPIPISKEHMRSRGYNQSSVFGRPLSLMINKPFIANAIVRTKNTLSQVHLSREQRFTNLQSAFSVNSATLIDKKVLLVDDISTTGATLISCSKVLMDSGCKEVFCLTIARTIKNHQ
jgi:ComF family protein